MTAVKVASLKYRELGVTSEIFSFFTTYNVYFEMMYVQCI